MKPIIINEKNKNKITEIIKTEQGRATCRTIEYSDIVSATQRIEKELGIPKTHLEGVRFEVDLHAQTFPNAYKYRAESTQFNLEYSKGKWRVSGITRYYTKMNGHAYECVQMPEDTKQAIIKSKAVF